MLFEKGIKCLTLSWVKRSYDDTFTLQMTDEANCFRDQYTGSLCRYRITDLHPNAEYKFRVIEFLFSNKISLFDYDLANST